MNNPLFEKININRLEIKNRIYMPAMHLNMAEDFEVTQRIIEFYRERAKGGAGMICMGYATIDELTGFSLNIGAHKDTFIPGLKKLSEAIKENGARPAVQLNHTGRYNYSFFLDGKRPVASSPIASRSTKEEPKELTLEEIREIIKNFGRAAARGKAVGFDAVEILCGTGYLISEFLSPLTNKRKDEYGGSYKNRMKFGLEILMALRKAVGEDSPLIVRMNGNDFMTGSREGSICRSLQEKFLKKMCGCYLC